MPETIETIALIWVALIISSRSSLSLWMVRQFKTGQGVPEVGPRVGTHFTKRARVSG